MRRSNLKKLIDTSTNVHYFAYCILKLLHGVYKIRTKVDLRENVFEKQWWMFRYMGENEKNASCKEFYCQYLKFFLFFSGINFSNK